MKKTIAIILVIIFTVFCCFSAGPAWSDEQSDVKKDKEFCDPCTFTGVMNLILFPPWAIAHVIACFTKCPNKNKLLENQDLPKRK